MIVHQISIFVENKSGTLLKVLELFKENNIQLIASTISDTVEYGIYRIICSEPMRAYEMLKAAGISANLSEVFAIMLDNRPGRAATRCAISARPALPFHTFTRSCWAGKVSLCSAQTMPRAPKG